MQTAQLVRRKELNPRQHYRPEDRFELIAEIAIPCDLEGFAIPDGVLWQERFFFRMVTEKTMFCEGQLYRPGNSR